MTVKYCNYDTGDNLQSVHLNSSLIQNLYILKKKNDCITKENIASCSSSGGKCQTYMDAYYFQTVVCFIFGLVWLIWFKKYLIQLQQLPESSWKIQSNKIKLN